MTDIRIFGLLCYAYNLNHRGYKFALKVESVFVGYPFTQKGWKLFDLAIKQYFVSRDLMFVEHTFPFGSSKSLSDVIVDVSIDPCDI